MKLTEARAAAVAELARIEREIAQGPCREYGHNWESIGGCNAGCCDDCTCSVPVNHCVKCGDCDYGDNDDAKAARAECAERRSWIVEPDRAALEQEGK